MVTIIVLTFSLVRFSCNFTIRTEINIEDLSDSRVALASALITVVVIVDYWAFPMIVVSASSTTARMSGR